MKLCNKFPDYTEYDPIVPVKCVTLNTGRIFHRFFDTSPISPSGRYLAAFRMPYEHKLPVPGDKGEVIVIDLETGEEEIVSHTSGWETQLGCNLQWGLDDTALFFNDVDTDGWKPYSVKLNPFTGEKQDLNGTIYRISPDGTRALSANMLTMRRTQEGYGVVVPDEYVPRNTTIRDDDGLFITNTDTGEKKLLVSIKTVLEEATPKIDLSQYEDGEFYGFHCKWNPQGTRILFSIRWFPKSSPSRFGVMKERLLKFDVFTMKPDGSEIHTAVPSREWAKGGHHINWFPDGEHLSMNLNIDREGLRFVKVRYDGKGLKKILDNIPGSGHPSIHRDGRYIITDSYVKESVAFGDGTTPIRLVDIKKKTEKNLIRIHTETEHQKECSSLRLDPHPAWEPEFKRITFNAYTGGTRRIYIADLVSVLKH